MRHGMTAAIGDGSFDALSGSLAGLFDFSHPNRKPLYLDPITGQPTGQK
jgi:phospholipase C